MARISIAGIQVPVGSILRMVHPTTGKPVMGIGWVVVKNHSDFFTLTSYPTGSSTEETRTCVIRQKIAHGVMRVMEDEVVRAFEAPGR